MKAVILVSQKGALKRGLNTYGEFEFEFNPAELTEQQRQTAAAHISYRKAVEFFGIMPGVAKDIPLPEIAEATMDTLRQLLDWQAEADKKRAEIEAGEKAKNRAKQEEAAARYVATPVGKLVSGVAGRYSAIGPYSYNYSPHYDDDLRGAVEGHYKLAQAEAERQNKEHEEAVREADARRAAQLDSWVDEYGDANMQARHHEGYLSEDEILAVVRDRLFAPLADSPRYEKITWSEVCDEPDYHSPDFDVDEEPTLSADEYTMLAKLRQALPGADITPRRHIGKCDECDAEVTRLGFRATLVVGEFTHTREYGLPSGS